MSQATNVDTSSAKSKRAYRKGNPLSPLQRQQSHVAKLKETHKEMRVYVEKSLKADLEQLCAANGMTQSAMIEKLIQDAVLECRNNVTD
ncbi:replication regulatory protein RepA [Citrobacter freundii]|uniref:replication regulatory protein RepA n=1 Tax=Enterobacteriaceae TaxID=543 RepID=UPI0009AE82F2|nr:MULTISPECIES: replication regulatory protein RepA [Enterobacteriaceae]EBV8441048.1 replication regulatory protein RepA [Salmonella enterica subsp. enterica serovar Chester]EBX8913790.1 ribbon-helix-helix protein, CopG family [Salmonella enterica subsp. enterica serovar Agoueve]EDV4423940.1 replication regulatory protein RepA [Salmonella enterica subsp. enterica]EEB0571187.1 replication regulatory protein RepA [Salmonella enterica subsp. enterica serovar Kintambo]EAU3389211.1 replication reg